MGTLKADDFYRPAHGRVFEAMIELTSRSEPVDEITLSAELKKWVTLESCGGIAFLNKLSMRVPTAANIGHYAKIVQKRSQARKLIKTATTIATSGYDDSADVEALLDQAATQILDLNTKTESGLTHMKNIVQDAFAMIEERFKEGSHYGVATGFHKFDDMTAGFQPGDLIIVAGRPSMGKTALALNMAQYAALKKEGSHRSILLGDVQGISGHADVDLRGAYQR